MTVITFGGGLGTDFDLDGGLVAFGGNRTSGPLDIATAVNAHGGPHGRLDFESETFVVGVTGQISHALKAEGADASEDRTGRGTPIIAFSAKDYGADASHDLAPTLRAGGHTSSHANAGVMPAIAFDTYNQSVSDVTHTLRDPHGTFGDALPAVFRGSAVRRLTPRECERLQGFQFRCDPTHPGAWRDTAERHWSPDYTAIPWRGRPASQCPDGPRYKALGNSWAVPKFRWLGERIARHMPSARAAVPQGEFGLAA